MLAPVYAPRRLVVPVAIPAVARGRMPVRPAAGAPAARRPRPRPRSCSVPPSNPHLDQIDHPASCVLGHRLGCRSAADPSLGTSSRRPEWSPNRPGAAKSDRRWLRGCGPILRLRSSQSVGRHHAGTRRAGPNLAAGPLGRCAGPTDPGHGRHRVAAGRGEAGRRCRARRSGPAPIPALRPGTGCRGSSSPVRPCARPPATPASGTPPAPPAAPDGRPSRSTPLAAPRPVASAGTAARPPRRSRRPPAPAGPGTARSLAR